MDPATILGLASNIWTLIDVGLKGVRQYKEFRRNGLHETRENAERRLVIKQLKTVSEELVATGPPLLTTLGQDCKAQCDRLLALLEELTVKDPNSRLGLLKAMAKAWWRASDISSLEDKLETYRKQFRVDFLKTIRDDPLKFAEIISNLNHHVSQLGVSQSTELAKYHSELQQAMEIYRDGSGLVINDKLGLLLEQRDLFAVLGPTVSLLKELRFEGIYDREDAIKPPIQGTFSMDESEEDRENVIQSLVLPWLRSGSGVLHISGKAGSGKSTLMKQMVTHPCTRQSLEAWAGDGELLYAAFFFWAPGNKEEKSMNGLRRSLLYRILSHNTALIPEFQDTFSTTTPGRCRQQIHLHTLNEPEIEKHCQHVFQKAQEEFPVLSGALKELGHDFARQLASRAEGVFLWAVLVARMLISEAKRGGSRDDLERKLKETPDDMNELYDKMFNLLQPSYRQFSNRLLLLVLTNPFRHDVSALCVKQLASKDTWQSGIPDSFTYQDAVSDIEYVEKHLDVLTQGLIEVVKSNQSDDSNLLDKTRLKLFHKTAWDYLRYSRLSELQSGYADFGPENIHSTLRLKELAVVKRIDIRYYNKCLHNYSYEMLETKRVERVGLARNQIGYFELTEAAIHDLQGLEINT